MKTDNKLHRFLFDDMAVRGEIVRICSAYSDVLKNHHYPLAVKRILGELMAATSLLTATLKFEGEITVQIQGNGPVNLAVINGNEKLVLRGIARIQQDIGEASSLPELFGDKAHMVITITPKQGERYQGIVALTQDTLAQCLEDYFQQSEQLATRIWLFTDLENTIAGGALLQILPESAAPSVGTNDFSHVTTLMDTLTADELFSLPADALLYRLFHQESVRLFPPASISFECGCSRKKCEDALYSININELTQQLEESGSIDMTCEYCLTTYSFNRTDIDALQLNKQQMH